MKLTNKEKRKIKKAGRRAYHDGLFTNACPYDVMDDTDERAESWFGGYNDAVEEDLLEDY